MIQFPQGKQRPAAANVPRRPPSTFAATAVAVPTLSIARRRDRTRAPPPHPRQQPSPTSAHGARHPPASASRVRPRQRRRRTAPSRRTAPAGGPHKRQVHRPRRRQLPLAAARGGRGHPCANTRIRPPPMPGASAALRSAVDHSSPTPSVSVVTRPNGHCLPPIPVAAHTYIVELRV